LEAGGWPGLFPREGPLELEIGFGNGEYLARSAESSPGSNFVGLEVSWNSLKRALRRLALPPRTNVRVLHLPARPALSFFFTPKSVSVARCLFPVPWPNERHAGKRIFSRPFWDLMAGRLVDGGLFQMVTDQRDLALWALAEARGSAMEFSLRESRELLDTKYERKWLSGGQDVFFHLEGRKTRHQDINEPGLVDMQPHYSSSLDPRDYRPKNRSQDPTVVFGEFLYDQSQGKGLLAAKVVEDQFIQEFYIRVSKLPEGGFKLAPTGRVCPTMGVEIALELASLAPETRGGRRRRPASDDSGTSEPAGVPGTSETSRTSRPSETPGPREEGGGA
jgi:tRNA (guanine-N7-)-methyltransferase